MAYQINLPFFFSALALLVMGLAYNIPPVTNQRTAVPGCGLRVGQQPDSIDVGLVHDQCDAVATHVADDFVLDDRRVLHGQQTICRVPTDQ